MVDLCRDDVLLLVSIKGSNAFDAQIVRFSCSAGEDDLFSRGSDKVGDLVACRFTGLLSVPAERVRSGVRIAKLFGQVGQHFVEDARVGRSGRLIVEIERSVVTCLSF